MDRKRMKLSPAGTENTIEVRAVHPPIYKLDTDCCDHIFDYFHLKDLHTIAQTSKTMQRVAGEYFKRNYYTLPIHESAPAFHRFIRKLELSLRFRIPLDKFESLNHLKLDMGYSFYDEDSHQFSILKKILPKVRTLELLFCHISYDFHENILKHCESLERLSMLDSRIDHDIDEIDESSWLLQTYPTLKYLRIVDISDEDFENIGRFIVRNSSIRTFSTNMKSIAGCYRRLLDSSAAIDTLDISVFREKEREWKSGCHAIDTLRDHGFHKRLYLNIYEFNQQLIYRIAELKGIERLFLSDIDSKLNWPSFSSVKELGIIRSTIGEISELELMVKVFENVECLYLVYVTAKEILPFIGRLKKLNRIKVNVMRSPTTIDLLQWNKEREKLNGARKIIVYVEDNVFVPTKWKMFNGVIDFNMIEMRRCDSYEWDPLL